MNTQLKHHPYQSNKELTALQNRHARWADDGKLRGATYKPSAASKAVEYILLSSIVIGSCFYFHIHHALIIGF